MSSLIQQVISSACRTFARHPQTRQMIHSGEELQDFLAELKKLVNRLTAQEVGLDRSEAIRRDLENTNEQERGHKQSPISYIEVFENKDVSVGIFIIHSGCRIPLHNHPGMYGLIKCLYGRIDITSFTRLSPDEEAQLRVKQAGDERGIPTFLQDRIQPGQENEIFPAKKQIFKGFTVESTCSCLTPLDKNYHELESVQGPAAFIDILAPPYSPEDQVEDNHREVDKEEERRDCDFFENLSSPLEESEDRGVAWLKGVESPVDYYCDAEDYVGPPFQV